MRSVTLVKATVVLFAVSCLIAAGAYAQTATYVGSGQCKICHNKKEDGEQHTKWKDSKHAKAFETLSTDAAKAAATKKGVAKPPAEAPECLQCHVTAADPATGKAPEKIVPADGVGCESCHGPASEHIAEAKKFKSGDKAATPAAKIKKGDEATCKTCHNEKSPTFKPFDYKERSAKIAHPNPNKAK